ncbi:peptide-methionine (S)-S-oxide reductase MsrA [Pontibacillus salicampi]|uniref:Peptide methionine sulfoxide reductase MsrA n=1 Tax=Pontibacillus salicampi TaxID=1449801 RepID=A0ABV6LMR9_9BACI
MATAYFGAGCFWGVEAFFERLTGVTATRVGYSGGTVENPSYELVKSGVTGHAETTKVEFDPSVISYASLVDQFFEVHDPTQINRQGEDVGTQYRSVIFFLDDEQRQVAEEKIQEWSDKGIYKLPIATQIKKAAPFYDAEEYHQKYLQKHGSVSCGI